MAHTNRAGGLMRGADSGIPLIKVADEVWIATALLHKGHPERSDFSVDEIAEKVRVLGLAAGIRPGVRVHILQHCVANRPPNPGAYRMLFETAIGRRRLHKAGDQVDPRRHAKLTPRPEDIPSQYRDLLDWYEHWSPVGRKGRFDGLLSLTGSGRDIWRDAREADAYVNELRESWE